MPLYNWQRQSVGNLALPGDIFNVPVRRDILHRVVRWQLAKRQQVCTCPASSDRWCYTGSGYVHGLEDHVLINVHACTGRGPTRQRRVGRSGAAAASPMPRRGPAERASGASGQPRCGAPGWSTPGSLLHQASGTVYGPFCCAVQRRGGGIIFGPVVRSHAHDLQKKVRQLGLKCALSVRPLPRLRLRCTGACGSRPVLTGEGAVRQAKAAEGRLTVVDTLALEPAKTVGALAA